MPKDNISQKQLKKLGFEIQPEQKRAVKYLNAERSLSIQIESDKTVWLSLDGFKAETSITTTEELENFCSNFKNKNIVLPF